MICCTHLDSPLGGITLAGEGNSLTGLWFDGQKHFAAGLSEKAPQRSLPVFAETERWLALYFQGVEPDFTPPLRLIGTPFQREVWALLQQIPYGGAVSYGALAARIAEARGLARFSAQAVGSAVSRNPISILVPCHRVLGADGSLTGYAGGLQKKAALLRLEGMVLPHRDSRRDGPDNRKDFC